MKNAAENTVNNAKIGQTAGEATVWATSLVGGVALVTTFPMSTAALLACSVPYLYTTYQLGKLGGYVGAALGGTGTVVVEAGKGVVNTFRPAVSSPQNQQELTVFDLDTGEDAPIVPQYQQQQHNSNVAPAPPPYPHHANERDKATLKLT